MCVRSRNFTVAFSKPILEIHKNLHHPSYGFDKYVLSKYNLNSNFWTALNSSPEIISLNCPHALLRQQTYLIESWTVVLTFVKINLAPTVVFLVSTLESQNNVQQDKQRVMYKWFWSVV